MKKFAIPAICAALALAACDQSETTVEAPEPTETETAVVTDTVAVPVDSEEGSSLSIDGGDVDATISEDGVDANIKVD